MPLHYSQTVIDELKSVRATIVPGFRIEPKRGGDFRVAPKHIPAAQSFDGCVYQAWVKKLGAIVIEQGIKTDGKVFDLTLKNDPARGRTTGFWREVDNDYSLEGARISMVWLFPDAPRPENSLGTWDDPFAGGRIVGRNFVRGELRLSIGAGFMDANIDALWEFSRRCLNDYGGFGCPRDVWNGIGLPEGRATGSIVSINGDTVQIDSSFADVNPGDILLEFATKKRVRVVEVLTDTTARVSAWVESAPAKPSTAPAAGGEFICGPQRTECGPGGGKFLANCIENGMKAKSGGQPEDRLNVITNDFFQALSSPVQLVQSGPASGSLEDFHTNLPVGNSQLDGRAIRQVYGRAWVREHIFTAELVDDSRRFGHNLITWHSGSRVSAVDSLTVRGYRPDNGSRRGPLDDGRIDYGFFGKGADDKTLFDEGVLTADQWLAGVGSRQSRHHNSNQVLDTYGDETGAESPTGAPFGNPPLFASPAGDGPSRSRLAQSFVRVDTVEGEVRGGDRARITACTKMVPGSPSKPGDEELGQHGWTSKPNPMDGVLHLLTIVHEWHESSVDVSDLLKKAARCDEKIPSTQSSVGPQTGTILFTQRTSGLTIPSNLNDWVFVGGQNWSPYVGTDVTIAGSVNLTREIRHVLFVDRSDEREFDPEIRPRIPDPDRGISGSYVHFTEAFTDAQTPNAGDTISVQGPVTRRYTLNGVLEKQQSIAKALLKMARAANATVSVSSGKIRFPQFAPADLGLVDQFPTLTDKGSTGNIWKVLEAKWDPIPRHKQKNRMKVEYGDLGDNGKRFHFFLEDEAHQRSLNGREIKASDLSLGFVKDFDTAVRIGKTAFFREGTLPGQLEPGKLNVKLHLWQALFMQLIEGPESDEPSSGVWPVDCRDAPPSMTRAMVEKISLDWLAGTGTVVMSPYYEFVVDDSAPDAALIKGNIPIGGSPPDEARELQNLTIEFITDISRIDDSGDKVPGFRVVVTPPTS